jgi:hypothetical protein
MGFMLAPRRPYFLICALSLVGSALLYGRTLTYGFDWDDYHFMLPYTLQEVREAWSGPWDARADIEPAFYRPVTIAFYAARIWLFGFNPMALHALSVLLFAIANGLLVWWMIGLGLSHQATLAGTLIFLTHPAMATSAVAWITSQMHLLQLLLVLSALILATAGSQRWPWLVGLQIVTLLVKEDGIVLAPAVAAVWLVRGERVRPGWIAASAGTMLAFIGLRTWALGGLGGYAHVSYALETVSGPLGVVSGIVNYEDIGPANWIAALGLTALGGLVGWRGWPAPSPAVQSLALSALLVGIFNAPLILASGPSRWHLLVLCLSVGVAAAVQLLEQTGRRAAGLAIVSMIVVAFSVSNWNAVNHFAPCDAVVLRHDTEVRSWGDSVPPVLRDDLMRKVCP